MQVEDPEQIPPAERQKLIAAALPDRHYMRFHAASISSDSKGNTVLVKQYLRDRYPKIIELTWRYTPGHEDRNNEMFAEMVLIDEEL